MWVWQEMYPWSGNPRPLLCPLSPIPSILYKIPTIIEFNWYESQPTKLFIVRNLETSQQLVNAVCRLFNFYDS